MGVGARLARHATPVLVSALVVGLALWRWADADPLSGKLEGVLLDIRFQVRGPLPPPTGVVIVAIDEQAVGAIGAYAPLRAALAKAMPIIAAAGPRAIAIDMLLADPTDADDALASAFGRAGPVLLAAATTGARDGSREVAAASPRAPEHEAALARSAIPVVIGPPAPEGQATAPLLLPVPELAARTILAHVNVTAGEDAAVRAVPMAIPAGDGRLLPSMALAAARFGPGGERADLVYNIRGAIRVGTTTIPLDRRGRLTLDHYGPPGSIPTVGLLDVLEGRPGSGTFAGKVVFIGSTAPSLRDEFATPFGRAVAGVEILATAGANIIEGRQIVRDPGTFGLSLLVGFAAALAALAAFGIPSMALATAAAFGAWTAAAAALQLAFAEYGLWLDGVTVLGALGIATAAGGWTRLGREQRRSTNLAHYISPTLVHQLSESSIPSFDGREQDVGLLFVDVSGYSSMVESRPPAEVAVFLRELHELFADAAEAHGGVIVDYQGDGALTVFGLPEAGARDAANALACAEALLAGRGRVHAAFLTGPVQLRVSVHWGPVACAVLGGSRHAVISVTGDAVNVTARLQEFAKEHDVPFVATRAVLDAAGGPPGFRLVGSEPLRGRTKDIEIWTREQVLGQSPSS